MLAFIIPVAAAVRVFLPQSAGFALEVLALRQHLAVLKRQRPRPAIKATDRFFWITLRNLWPRWSDVLLIVKPEAVVGWHRAGFRLFWRWRSHPRSGRPKISDDLRTLIPTMATENLGWGAPKIHGELLKLGFAVSERTVGRYFRTLRRRGNAGNRWAAFLNNHREAIAAMDMFTVPTAAFRTMYCFFVIEHARRKILHFNVTTHPSSEWVV